MTVQDNLIAENAESPRHGNIGKRLEFSDIRGISAKNKARIFGKTSGTGSSAAERIRSDVFPTIHHEPKFKIDRDAKFFTIGSCFARNIEAELHRQGVEVITRRETFDADLYELQGLGARTGALNAYTVHSMEALVGFAQRPDAPSVGVVRSSETADEWYDMMVSGLRALNETELAEVRRKLISVYGALSEADVVVLTLGYTESWYDKTDGIFVNKSPGGSRATMRHADRFQFLNADGESIGASLDRTIAEIRKQTGDRAKVVISVSPVPMNATWTERDVVVANSYSKSTLVSQANSVASKYDYVDYYPSYEMVTNSDRGIAWLDDGVHVNPAIVERVIGQFCRTYFSD